MLYLSLSDGNSFAQIAQDTSNVGYYKNSEIQIGVNHNHHHHHHHHHILADIQP